ncbi:IucA/IucC family protein [Actinacidiphila guanduensis]|uniref:Siderophore synthetase component n=1 Tax=Actinacidiphila guanduensis TaxID=310781 RepID=A0A1H0GJ52_9ACTN|nr:Siderophore synthetase component [Actinacidiphila guanduensis]
MTHQPAVPPSATAHLTPELWQRATRHLLRKALAEFAHERLIHPEPEREPAPAPETEPAPEAEPAPRGATPYTLLSDDGRMRYRFTACRLALDHWHIDPASIERTALAPEPAADPAPEPARETTPCAATTIPPDTPSHTAAVTAPRTTTAPPGSGTPLPLDALAFLTEFRTSLTLTPEILPVYMEEITATLASLAYRFAAEADARRPSTAAELARAPFQAVEAAMTEGHPCFVANSGRLGFGVNDLPAYAPEAGAPVRLMWLAARKERTRFAAGAGVTYASLLEGELDPATRRRFDAVLRDQGLDPADYLLVPVHPWQWEHRIAVTFAGEVAQRHLVLLGPGDDAHLPQQSVRTFFNATHPERRYVKTSLSVLNMGFLRGLSAAYMEATPAINDWVAGLIAADPTLTAARFSIIRECASVGYHPLPYEAATAPGSPYRKMLAALWRESPVPGLAAGESLVTMAALLHTDSAGGSLAAALVARSGLPPERWLRRYLDAYLVPVLHSLFAYDLAYMPHGENVILVLDADGAVDRVVFKDIAEEVVVMGDRTPLPPAVRRIRAEVPAEQQVLSVFTDVFDGFLRFLSAILHTGNVLDETVFWRTVAACAADYQRAHPQLADAFRRHDLFAPEFARSCLNRLQLRDNRQMVDLSDPSAALQFAGTLRNPLAEYGRHGGPGGPGERGANGENTAYAEHTDCHRRTGRARPTGPAAP